MLTLERPESHTDAVKRLHVLFQDKSISSIRAALHEEGFKVLHDGGTYYVIDFQRHMLINLHVKGFDLE